MGLESKIKLMILYFLLTWGYNFIFKNFNETTRCVYNQEIIYEFISLLKMYLFVIL